jgi:hypothetical protein
MPGNRLCGCLHIIYLGKNTNYVGKYTEKYWEPQLLVT